MQRPRAKITLRPTIYVSSGCDYHCTVVLSRPSLIPLRGQARTYHINEGAYAPKRAGASYQRVPTYQRQAILAQLGTMLAQDQLRFYEVDRDGQKRWEDLRYYDPATFAWLIGARPTLEQLERRALYFFYGRYYGVRFQGGVYSFPANHIDFLTTPLKSRAANDGEALYIEVAPAGEAWADFEPDMYDVVLGEPQLSERQCEELTDLDWSSWRVWEPGSY